jgi:N-acetyl-gamma-glutamyl-phosphate reductase
LLENDIHINAITGSTGAGQRLSATSHFTWRHSNISLYKPFEHQHLYEIGQTLNLIQSWPIPDIHFLPYRGNFTRGILASVYSKINADLNTVKKIFDDYYMQHPFVILSEINPDVKQVLNTNKAMLNVQKKNDTILIVSAIDNLVKGAAGQAVQNMNLMFGFDETCGLRLKPSGY